MCYLSKNLEVVGRKAYNGFCMTKSFNEKLFPAKLLPWRFFSHASVSESNSATSLRLAIIPFFLSVLYTMTGWSMTIRSISAAV